MKIGFIGCGNMGGAIAEAIGAKDVKIELYDKCEEKAESLKNKIGESAEISNINEMLEDCEYIFLGVKPNIIEGVLFELGEKYTNKNIPCLVSMAAGVELFTLQRYLGDKQIPVIRIMPNMPVKVKKGMTVWCANPYVSDVQKDVFKDLMSCTGWVDELPESLIDAECALAGCGPAFVCMFAEALADGGVKCGLPRDKAAEYALNTIIGTAKALKETKDHPGELKDKVCSPGGSTIEGVYTLEKGAFRGNVTSAVWDAYGKTKALGKK